MINGIDSQPLLYLNWMTAGIKYDEPAAVIKRMLERLPVIRPDYFDQQTHDFLIKRCVDYEEIKKDNAIVYYLKSPSGRLMIEFCYCRNVPVVNLALLIDHEIGLWKKVGMFINPQNLPEF